LFRCMLASRVVGLTLRYFPPTFCDLFLTTVASLYFLSATGNCTSSWADRWSQEMGWLVQAAGIRHLFRLAVLFRRV
jgi:hypothetical protein